METHKNAKYLKYYANSNGTLNEDGTSFEEIDLQYIVDECPSTSIVREFFEANLKCVIDDEEEMFEQNFENKEK